MKCDKKDMLLYAVTDRSWTQKESLCEQVEKALKGGVTILQMREKNLSKEAFIEEAWKIKEICKRYEVPFIINDSVEIALAVDADGVHVGQSDMAAAKAREVLGPDKIIGVSAKTVEQAMRAQEEGADYLGVGAVFSTTSKADAKELEWSTLREICDTVDIPVVAIGGITKANAMQLAGHHVDGIAVISAIFAQEDIEAAARELKEISSEMISR